MFLVLVALTILMIAIYIWVFAVNTRTETPTNLLLLGLENMNIETFLLGGQGKSTLLTFYENPSGIDPFIDISYGYTTDPGSNLEFFVYTSGGASVGTTTVTKKSVTGFKEVRIYFNKVIPSDFYTLKYTLPESAANSDNIEIVRIELKV